MYYYYNILIYNIIHNNICMINISIYSRSDINIPIYSRSSILTVLHFGPAGDMAFTGQRKPPRAWPELAFELPLEPLELREEVRRAQGAVWGWRGGGLGTYHWNPRGGGREGEVADPSMAGFCGSPQRGGGPADTPKPTQGRGYPCGGGLAT